MLLPTFCQVYISLDIVGFALKNKNIVNVLQDIKHLALFVILCNNLKKKKQLEQGAWKVLWSFMTSSPCSFKYLYHVGTQLVHQYFFALLHLIPAAWTDVIRHVHHSGVFSCMLIKRCIYKGGRVYELNTHRMPLGTVPVFSSPIETHFLTVLSVWLKL